MTVTDDPDDHGEFDGLEHLVLAQQIWHRLERTCHGTNTTLSVTWDQLRAAVLDCAEAGYLSSQAIQEKP
jgi:hypothetical protein